MKVIGLIILIVLCLLAFFAFFCLIAKVKIIIDFGKAKGEKFKKKIYMQIPGGTSVELGKKNAKSAKAKKEPAEKSGDSKKNRSSTKQAVNIISGLVRDSGIGKKIFVEKLQFSMTLGLDDAANTAVASGAAWAAVYDIVALIAANVCIAKPQISIKPNFDEEIFEFDGRCIISFRLVNIIGKLLFYIIKIYFKNRKITKNEKAAI